jgi:hypothetical protein
MGQALGVAAMGLAIGLADYGAAIILFGAGYFALGWWMRGNLNRL